MLTQEGAKTQAAPALLRHDWSRAQVEDLFAQPFNDLLHQAQRVHRCFFDPNSVQLSTLFNIRSGGCPEDCAYCPQSARYDTDVEVQGLTPLGEVIDAARAARAEGATRFCMGAAWRSPRGRDFERVLEMVNAVKDTGMETCVTLGMLSAGQAQRLRDAGLDFYNHNLDTSPEYYPRIISTRTYQDRLDTLDHVRRAGISVCCGGIVGMGESRSDRAGLLQVLATLPQHPESVPINLLIRVQGTPLAGAEDLDPFEFVRTIAVARILMPASKVRLSAGRNDMPESLQAMCFHAGANSIFYGEKLLTTDNPQQRRDRALLQRLGMRAGD